MKKYSLLFILGCFGSHSFASDTFPESFSDSLLEFGAPVEHSPNLRINRSIAKLNAFLNSLEVCKATLNMLTLADIDPEVSEELQSRINDIVAHIENMQEKIAGIMPHLQQAESADNFATGNYFESINFDALLDGFIRIENVTLQWLKNRKSSFNEESYNHIKRAIKISMEVALGLKLVTIMGAGIGVFSCTSCCEVA
ncbi:MAG: hypothetical protein LBB05_01425 [Puniceicoccales bacterium]|nr:hypothetical protein [Puniceicoccales bacterium]